MASLLPSEHILWVHVQGPVQAFAGGQALGLGNQCSGCEVREPALCRMHQQLAAKAPGPALHRGWERAD